ncbi:MAG: metallopeptidase family protein [Dehalococcoidia bacterium]|nr:metallopeptidase family protein [Dehalococcoidia bacterium]MCA9856041.1 metallopeptidase family protein [Dehalococcoidia bacterium]MCB9482430.1 metallopeptidase family protein [Dehalococcoidia bacterium]MCB9491249.1 metallopeptidase family protein [Dehalococcoidia bacterium]
MDRRQFEQIVERALTELPPVFADRLENVAVVIRDEPTEEDLDEAGLEPGEELFGLYVGVPLTERGEYHMVLPDRILIFQGPHERHFQDEELLEEIQRTVVHEIAHFFGIDDERLHELGYA